MTAVRLSGLGRALGLVQGLGHADRGGQAALGALEGEQRRCRRRGRSPRPGGPGEVAEDLGDAAVAGRVEGEDLAARLGERGETVGAPGGRGPVGRGQRDVAAAGLLDPARPAPGRAGWPGSGWPRAPRRGCRRRAGSRRRAGRAGRRRGRRRNGPPSVRGRPRAGTGRPSIRALAQAARAATRSGVSVLGPVHGRPAGGRQHDEDHRQREQGAQGGRARVGAEGGGVGKAGHVHCDQPMRRLTPRRAG